MCNQNFDQWTYFHCVARSDDIWMVWTFHQKKSNEDNDIMEHVPKFLNVHHVVVKTFQKTSFLRCDCFLYERWVECIKWIHIHVEVIYIYTYEFTYIMNLYIKWILLYHEFIFSSNSSNRHVLNMQNSPLLYVKLDVDILVHMF